MNRLTKRICNQAFYQNQYGNTILCGEMTVPQIRECVSRLAAYENTGLEPEEINKHFDGYVKEIERLRGVIRHFEVLKHQERLIELPCKVGQPLFTYSHIRGCIKEFIAPDKTWIFENMMLFGKEVFLTREEAVKALKEQEEV